MSAYLERVKNRLPGGGSSDSKPASSSSSSGSGSISGLGIRNHKSFTSGGSDNSYLGASSNRAAQPLSSLRDPASFGPPPRHVGRRVQPPPDTQQPGGSQLALPAPPSQRYEDLSPSPSSNTDHEDTYSPPLPARRDSSTNPNNRPPPSPRGATSAPSLPPRLPPRTNSASPTLPPRPSSQADAVAHSKYGLTSNLNQGAISRLGAAGISVPAFGIGSSSSHEAPPPPPSRGSGSGSSSAQLNGLQSRFSRLGTGSTAAPSTSTNDTSTGTTWAQKQAALKTAAALRQDPSSVSFADAKAAASTMKNFRQRHGEQVAAGVQGASNLQQKYGGMLNTGRSEPVDGAGQGRAPSPAASVVASLAAKKKPPPPPPKKPSSMSQRPATSGNGGPAPPPVPLSTRPQF
ncbi:hypothetical protein B0T22DRAFT_291505 [Podospora appendiculata]|uniref:Uncharacterized protein n=1 Tax=Podospora appendiculata TaxID=314037 RepID=A0AAE1C8E0_9PEZI|nr:hypothetical protein B0T22DRAFT_291505 [Podospora appendiculata]